MQRIIIEEDDTGISDALMLLLQSEGYETLTRQEGQSLLDYIESELPDLVLMDYWLPEKSGGDLCMALKRHVATKGIPVIMMSANTKLATLADLHLADDYIPKPFDVDLLLNKIQYWLDAKA